MTEILPPHFVRLVFTCSRHYLTQIKRRLPLVRPNPDIAVKLSAAKAKFEAHYFDQVEIRKNPGDIRENIALLYGRDGKSFMLCDDNDTVISSLELGELVLMLQRVGFRKAKIYF